MVSFSGKPESIKTTNIEGGESFKLSAKETISQIVPTLLMGEPKFYGGVEDILNKAVEQVARDDPEFILKLAGFTRNKMYLRTVAIYLLAKAANIPTCKPFVREWTPNIVARADELYEAVACHISLFSDRKKQGKLKLPNSLKKGLAKAFEKFDEYQLAKYDRKKDVTIKDVMCLVHPKRTELTEKIHDGTLAVPYTWETELSTKGNKAEVWEKLIDSGKLPFMAMLRNINNMDKAGISTEHWNKVMSMIGDKKLVARSKQLPFRFYSAMKHTQVSDPFKRKELEKALSTALDHSVTNLPKLEGRTFVACDSSGSMSWTDVSRMAKVNCAELGCLFGAMTYKLSSNSIIGLFDSNLKIFTTVSDKILTATNRLVRACDGGATHGHLTVKYLNEKKIKCDRIIMFTDMEIYGGSLQTEINKYRKDINPEFKVYVINLNGYGDCAVNPRDKHTYLISGWSDKIFQFINTHEEGTNGFIKAIESYNGK